jgi:hypothetical protein
MAEAEMKCAEIQEMLPSYARGEGSLSIRRHLARCPECRVELTRYQALVGGLESMQQVALEPPFGLLPALLRIPGERTKIDLVRTHVLRNKKMYGGVAVALVGATGAALWRTRTRQTAPA